MDEFGSGLAPVVNNAALREVLFYTMIALAIGLTIFIVVMGMAGTIALVVKEIRGKADESRGEIRGVKDE
jgi:heme/copper-type cytochrome/quinol oxidase subunit 2